MDSDDLRTRARANSYRSRRGGTGILRRSDTGVGVGIAVAMGVSPTVGVEAAVPVSPGVGTAVLIGDGEGVASRGTPGIAEGCLVSRGAAVGVSVGATVGVAVGATVGVAVGATVSVAVRATIAGNDGLAEGSSLQAAASRRTNKARNATSLGLRRRCSINGFEPRIQDQQLRERHQKSPIDHRATLHVPP
jgi:hypothetical protein